ncbi:hypothetical protein BD289DRAFT_136161 [Coniella lustricola]|uniref:STB6-like N-terminal domain-containing protein n=1 Tax=Coniella lustricola TaxID=2025994 RepID=A0A2T3AFH6_9PEZI|nr:hypothetical protein BD289DRAFT_136161 [Coniella lustricola]
MATKQSRPEARLQKDEPLAQSKKTVQPHPAIGNAAAPLGAHRLDGPLSVETTSPALPSGADRRNVVLPDPVAFRYLAEDPTVQVVESRGELRGYELYLVEQWACSRQSPALVVATYTGDPKHTVMVGVLAVPADRNDWSLQLKFYFDAIQLYHARPKETELGELMVTNLSNFPSALTVISVPDGDMKKHRQAFIVNEDLKRMGCSGRSGMTLTDPTPATQAKFYATYKIHEKVPFSEAVLDLVKLCQVALFIFGMLDYGYIDGLLCDATETAIGNWWTEIGSEYYNMEPTDGILGPSTVAALLGTLMGARNRLSSFGAPVTKDVFDIDHTKRAIGQFQKSQKVDKTRRLDRQTLLKLHKVTAKAAAGEEWGVQKAINSTVSQFGKRGEILSGVIGTREKAGISEIETVDIDKFKELVHGERCKWLWRGKPRRVPHEHPDRSLPDMTNLFGKEEEREKEQQREKEKESAGPNRKISFPPEDLEPTLKTRETTNTLYSIPTPGSTYPVPDSATDGALHKQMFKSVADRVSDARSGLGRIRDAVGGGLKSHGNRPKDESSEVSSSAPGIGGPVQSPSALSSPMASGKVFTWQNKPQEYLNAFQRKHPDNIQQSASEYSQTTSQATSAGILSPLPETGRKSLEMSEELENVRKDVVTRLSVAPSSVDESDLLGPFLQAERNGDASFPVLQRRHSVATPNIPLKQTPMESRWPRRLSFSAAAEAVLYWDELVDLDEAAGTLESQGASAEFTQALYGHILNIQNSISPWVTAKVKDVEALEEAYKNQDESLQEAYYSFSDEHQRMKQNSTEMIAEEKGRVTMAIKDVEVQAAKLEYEINALLSKVQDVEDGIAGFEANVVEVEKQAEELKKQLETESLVHWLVRTLTGIGTGPNITRED